jgi:putative sterol carrier protein
MASDTITAFFEGLAERGHEPLLQSTSGRLRFDLGIGKRVEHWYVTIKSGDLGVSHASGLADAVVRVDRALFEKIVQGRANGMTALLRGLIEAEGDLGLLMSFQRLFPAPPKSVYARRIK